MALLESRTALLSCLLTAFKNKNILSPYLRCISMTRIYTALNGRRVISTAGIRRKQPPIYRWSCVEGLPFRYLPISAVVIQCRATFSSGVESQCWKCQNDIPTDTEFCLSCKSLQPLNDHRDHFSVLGIQKKFNIDTKAMADRFRMLQTKFHPDRYTLKSEKEQQYAHDNSSAVNKAYCCLLHPVDRALYLLDLAGQPLHEGQLDLDPDFLTAIMEVNEELAEAKDRETVQAIGQRNTGILDSLLSEADAAFSSNDINKARMIVSKIKYYNNIYEKVKNFEREHGIID